MKKIQLKNPQNRIIGILGGSFNPIHRGHIRMAREAARLLGAQKVLLVTAQNPPHKKLPQKSPSATQRHGLVRLCEDGVLEACDIELGGEGKSYTVDTLEKLSGIYRDAEFCLIMGSDMFLSLEDWKSTDKILKLSGVCVFAREQKEKKSVREYARYLKEKYNARITVSNTAPFAASSTKVREMLSDNSTEVIKLVPEKVLKEIADKGFYGCDGDFYKILLEVKRRLSQRRFVHTLGVIEEARRLALRYGADLKKCTMAAAMHDITKETSVHEQLKLFEKYGEMPRGQDDRLPLYHSLSGAILAREEFNIDDKEIIGAVRHHTTACKDMTLCEKIIFLADFIEPGREFEGVDYARRLSYEDIDEAVKFAAGIVYEEVLSKGEKPHSDTAEAAGISEK